jgi:Zn-dependent peptidase ImmA (M78 family)/predicted secreted protein
MDRLGPARAEGVRAAAREHSRRGTDQTEPIDIFSIIEQARIWLMFQKMKSLYGAYVPSQDSPGILVNANHPSSVRRFTAAHEFGHFVCGHGPSVDAEDDINGRTSSTERRSQEACAQSFAAHFLMPPQLVSATLRDMGFPFGSPSITPKDIYLLSLKLGSSYQATLNHLYSLGIIDRTRWLHARRLAPKRLKSHLAGGRTPANPWADVWPLSQSDSGAAITPKVDDNLYLSLPEIPSTGYTWQIPDLDVSTQVDVDGNQRWLLLEEDSFEANDVELPILANLTYGAGGSRRLTLRVLRAGRYTLSLVRRRPWEDTPGSDAFVIEIKSSELGTGRVEQGLSIRQQDRLAVAA